MKLLGFFLGRSTRPTRIEKSILAAVAHILESSERTIFDAQVEAILKFQRLPDGVEVDFYMRDATRRVTEPPRFRILDDFILAKVLISMPDLDASLDADVRCVSGYIFSIEYKGSVRYFDEAMGMDPEPGLIVTAVRVGP